MKRFDGSSIYSWRIAQNLTQEQAADVLGVSTGSIRNWEQLIRKPPKHIALLIQRLKPEDYPTIRGARGKRPVGIQDHVRTAKPPKAKR